MDMAQLSKEEFLDIAVQKILKKGPMKEDDIFQAVQAFHRMWVDGVMVQAVLDGKFDVAWQNEELRFSVNKEELCKK